MSSTSTSNPNSNPNPNPNSNPNPNPNPKPYPYPDYPTVAVQNKLIELTAAVNADAHIAGTVDWYTPL